MVNLLDVMETLTRLNGEEAQLVEGGRDAETEVGAGDLDVFALCILLRGRGVQAQCTTPFRLPGGVRISQIQDVADTSASNDIVMAQKVASLVVDVDSHIGLATTQLARASHGRQVLTKAGGVHGITELQQGGESRQRCIVQPVQVRQISGLKDLVNIRLFLGEVQVLLDFVADRA